MSKANAEQQLAIHHSGGVLLKAGAGSGKTFVLVQHILHLTLEAMTEAAKSTVVGFEELIRQKYSRIVMMTFTKKAAGEMSIRLTEEFIRLSLLESPEQKLWKESLEALPHLTVTTIDGFCRKLITAGYFPHLSTEAEVIFEAERLDQVKNLFESWYEHRSATLPRELHEIVIREKQKLLENFSDVFADPGLRLVWKKFKAQDASPAHLGKVLQESFYLSGIDKALMAIGELELRSDKDRSAFEKNIGILQATGLLVVDTVEKLAIYDQIFCNISSLRGEAAKTKTPQHEAALEGAQTLRAWSTGDSKKTGWVEVITPYEQNFSDKILPWINVCLDIFNHIDHGLDPNQGMTFGDIEYHVALGLEDTAIRQRIQKIFSYFIVDEFQDTSSLQFKIISDLMGGDYKKLFCVGDPKQAIYGFRGGELSVFQNCALQIPVTRTLANNYRSLPSVIRFNNSLFRTILPAGISYENLDPFTVEAEDQNIPVEVTHAQPGEIEVISRMLPTLSDEEDEALRADAIDFEEAQAIADSIQTERANFPDRTCTILYRKLKPTKDLIRELIQRNIGFTAQYKIDLKDDPIVGMFLILLKRQFDTDDKTRDRWPLFMFARYLEILRIPTAPTVENLKSFDHDIRYWGLVEAFRKFLSRIKITNENADLNLGVISTLSDLYYQDQEHILQQIDRGSSGEIRLDFRFGKNAHRVQLMSAHASKGLEFDTVYLAGIYTNGRDKSESELFGKHPASFYWYQDLANRKKIKSPHYFLESTLSGFKNFSESKRLFYVAATRAKQKLIWIEFSNIAERYKVHKNSWTCGLTLWINSTRDADVLKALKVSPPEEGRELAPPEKSPDLPLYFHDTVGIVPRRGESSELAIMAELSVTRLNSLIDCPRKFYLENVLKLTPTGKPSFIREVLNDTDEIRAISASERGTLIHAHIATGIERNFIVPREAFDSEHRAPIEWALNSLKPLAADYHLIAEQPLKFKFFNFMISGIPDLYLLPKKDSLTAEIWDFKTGKITPTALGHYWIQLKVYAYALYQLGLVDTKKSIDLKLCFVDQKEVLAVSITFDTIKPELFDLWKDQNQPWKIKTEHCAQCSYGDICPR